MFAAACGHTHIHRYVNLNGARQCHAGAVTNVFVSRPWVSCPTCTSVSFPPRWPWPTTENQGIEIVSLCTNARLHFYLSFLSSHQHRDKKTPFDQISVSWRWRLVKPVVLIRNRVKFENSHLKLKVNFELNLRPFDQIRQEGTVIWRKTAWQTVCLCVDFEVFALSPHTTWESNSQVSGITETLVLPETNVYWPMTGLWFHFA